MAAHVNDATKRTNGVRPVDKISAPAGVLHDGAGDHDNVFGGAGELFDDQVHHLPKAGIFILEELRDAKEKAGGFVGRELFSRVNEESDLREQYTALPRMDRRIVEQARCWVILALYTAAWRICGSRPSWKT
jgi:hypothetical protein